MKRRRMIQLSKKLWPMKRTWVLLSILPHVLWSQVHFDFEDGLLPGEGMDPIRSMIQVPSDRWDCDSIEAISGDYSLHHSYDNPESGCDYLVFTHDPFVADDSLSFSFRIRHGYSPSSANNWQVALFADFNVGGESRDWDAGTTSAEEPFGITSGIILGVNYKGSDDMVKVWRLQDQLVEEICASTINYQEAVGTEAAPWFRLIWHTDGVLSLFYSTDPMTTPPVRIASCRPGVLPKGRSLVFRYEYSSAQDMKLWLDDIRLDGHFFTDTISPRITGWKFTGKNMLQLNFTEQIANVDCSSFRLSGMDETGFHLPGEGVVPDSLTSPDSTILLIFPGVVPNRESLVLSVSGVCDGDGNCMADTLVLVMRNEAVWGDVVFSEVMADPEPRVDLSLGEYMEFYNRSGFPLDMEGWQIHVGDRKYVFSVLEVWQGMKSGPETRLEPASYLVTTGITLPNTGEVLALYGREGTLLHAAKYSVPYDGPEWKKEGGWSLELPDPDLVCNTTEGWEFSTDRSGGTPGRLNSVDADMVDDCAPLFLYFGYGIPGTIRLFYSEPVRFSGGLSGQVTIRPGEVDADSVVECLPLSEQLTCYFPAQPALLNDFRIHLPGVPDCRGNLSHELVLQAGAVSIPAFGSVLINEIMYDPLEDAPEFIELYNPGPRFIDLEDLALGIADETAPKQLQALSGHSRIIGQGEYLVLSRDNRHLRDAYGLEMSGCWVEVDELNSLPNSGGTIYLSDRSGNTVDVVHYGDQMHMELMDDTRGISLERIAWDRPGSDHGNWHSAASIDGYATPGRINSQALDDSEDSGILVMEPEVFSPDNDGYNDLLGITLATLEQGSVIRLWITDLAGNPVRNLANNHITGPVSRYVWDGEQDDGSMAREGIYVVHVRGYHPVSGQRWNRKAATGLIYR